MKREAPPRAAAPRSAPQEAPGSGEAEFRSAPRPKLHASAPRDGAPKGKGPGTKGAFGKGKPPFGKGPGGPRGAGKPFRKGPRP